MSFNASNMARARDECVQLILTVQMFKSQDEKFPRSLSLPSKLFNI